MTTASNPVKFPNTRTLALDEASKALKLQSDKAQKIKEWIEPFHLLLIDAVKNKKKTVMLGDRKFILKPASNPLYYLIYPTDGKFVPMAQFSVERIEREVRSVKIEVI